MIRKGLVILALASLVGCSDDNGGADTGTHDVGTQDTGTTDGVKPPDNGPQPDMKPGEGTVADMGADDLGADTGGPDAASLSNCTSFPAGCTAMNYVDARTDATLRKVLYTGGTYKPKCLWVKTMQKVTFTGVTLQPITQFCGPDVAFTGGIGNTRDYTFNQSGTYGYEWSAGGTNLFRGVIKVTAF